MTTCGDCYGWGWIEIDSRGGKTCDTCGGTGALPKLCSDCPRVGYPTDDTRCKPCPRRLHEEFPLSDSQLTKEKP